MGISVNERLAKAKLLCHVSWKLVKFRKDNFYVIVFQINEVLIKFDRFCQSVVKLFIIDLKNN